MNDVVFNDRGPEWDGIWSGWTVLRIEKDQIWMKDKDGVERCFETHELDSINE